MADNSSTCDLPNELWLEVADQLWPTCIKSLASLALANRRFSDIASKTFATHNKTLNTPEEWQNWLQHLTGPAHQSESGFHSTLCACDGEVVCLVLGFDKSLPLLPMEEEVVSAYKASHLLPNLKKLIIGNPDESLSDFKQSWSCVDSEGGNRHSVKIKGTPIDRHGSNTAWACRMFASDAWFCKDTYGTSFLVTHPSSWWAMSATIASSLWQSKVYNKPMLGCITHHLDTNQQLLSGSDQVNDWWPADVYRSIAVFEKSRYDLPTSGSAEHYLIQDCRTNLGSHNSRSGGFEAILSIDNATSKQTKRMRHAVQYWGELDGSSVGPGITFKIGSGSREHRWQDWAGLPHPDNLADTSRSTMMNKLMVPWAYK